MIATGYKVTPFPDIDTDEEQIVLSVIDRRVGS